MNPITLLQELYAEITGEKIETVPAPAGEGRIPNEALHFCSLKDGECKGLWARTIIESPPKHDQVLKRIKLWIYEPTKSGDRECLLFVGIVWRDGERAAMIQPCFPNALSDGQSLGRWYYYCISLLESVGYKITRSKIEVHEQIAA